MDTFFKSIESVENKSIAKYVIFLIIIISLIFIFFSRKWWVKIIFLNIFFAPQFYLVLTDKSQFKILSKVNFEKYYMSITFILILCNSYIIYSHEILWRKIIAIALIIFALIVLPMAIWSLREESKNEEEMAEKDIYQNNKEEIAENPKKVGINKYF